MLVGRKAGFTLVELSLSIVFIAILSITVVLMINNTVATYQRGMTLNQVNTTGADLVDDIRTAIQNSPARDVKSFCATVYKADDTVRQKCENDGAENFVVVSRSGNVTGTTNVGTVPIYGVFCTGKYSYLWNSGYSFANGFKVDNRGNKELALRLKYRDSGGNKLTTSDEARLLKIRDDTRAVCIAATTTNKENYDNPVINTNNLIDISGDGYQAVSEEVVELLRTDVGNNTVLYDLSAAAPAVSDASDSIFYSLSFILGTIEGGININAKGDYCKPPSAEESNFTYCAINKFNFAVQATGE